MTADAANDRVTWVDVTKGLTITLVVFSHSMNLTPGAPYYVPAFANMNDALRRLRMPLFFFVAGFFVDRSLGLPWKDFIEKKLLNFLWLYVLWATIRFATTAMPADLLQGRHVDFTPLLRMFVDPAPTLWFIYALLIVFFLARGFRGVAPPTLFAVSCIPYAISVASGELASLSLVERIIRFRRSSCSGV